jgi:hypothetical protein
MGQLDRNVFQVTVKYLVYPILRIQRWIALMRKLTMSAAQVTLIKTIPPCGHVQNYGCSAEEPVKRMSI